MLNDWVDSGAAGGRVLLDPGAWSVGFAAHEMLHGDGLDHSFSDDTTFHAATWSAPGEYDDLWDEMSAMNIYTFGTANFSTSAVGSAGITGTNWAGWARAGSRPWAPMASGHDRSRLPPWIAVGAGFAIDPDPLQPRRSFQLLHGGVSAGRRLEWGIPGDSVLIHEVRGGTPYLLRSIGGDRLRCNR